jgi:hypothetical protein
MKFPGALVCVSAFVFLGTAPGFALEALLSANAVVRPPTTRSAPGPVMGIGLPAVVALGGYVWYRRSKQGK